MSGISRRAFLSSAAAAAGAPVFGVVAKAPNVTFGVLSDVHLNKAGDEDTLLKAFAYFRDNGVDGVLIAGDIADRGLIEQMERCADCWWRTFPDGKAPDGRRVEQLFIYGNHDIDGWTWHKRDDWILSHGIGPADNRSKTWERLYKEPYSPIWAKKVKGYTFIGAHWGSEKDLDSFLQSNAERLGLSSGRPFF